MDGQNERCISCMEEKPVGKSCPNCGYTGEDEGQAPYLKMGVKLQNRYLVGRMLSFNGEGVSYIAYDLAEEAKILIREFFPQTVAFREDDGVTVSAMAGGEGLYEEGGALPRFSRHSAGVRHLYGKRHGLCGI